MSDTQLAPVKKKVGAPLGNKNAVGNCSGGKKPTLYRRSYIAIVKGMCELGATDDKICEALGICRSTLYSWKLKHKEFNDALVVAKNVADECVERSLYMRANGFEYNALHFTSFQGEVTETPYKEYVPPDPTSMIFWLKNRMPHKWRDKHEHVGDGGGPIVLEAITPMRAAELLKCAPRLLEAAEPKVKNAESNGSGSVANEG